MGILDTFPDSLFFLNEGVSSIPFLIHKPKITRSALNTKVIPHNHVINASCGNSYYVKKMDTTNREKLDFSLPRFACWPLCEEKGYIPSPDREDNIFYTAVSMERL